jgi:hypothetical protein
MPDYSLTVSRVQPRSNTALLSHSLLLSIGLSLRNREGIIPGLLRDKRFILPLVLWVSGRCCYKITWKRSAQARNIYDSNMLR